MDENTNEDPLKKLAPESTGDAVGQPSASTENEIDTQKNITEEMEVHHHAHHHGKKNWKSYVFEFFMLFLAVFCGYLAEYQLEKNIERHREKEFIVSMIEDAMTDTASIRAAIPLNLVRINNADSLADVCFNFNGTREQTDSIYHFTDRCLYRPDLVYPTDRTLFQLKNAGGMRLIRNEKASKNIIDYDNSGKRLVNQQTYYEMYLTNLTTNASQLINISNFFKRSHKTEGGNNTVKYINPDKLKMMEYGNNAIMYRGVFQQYVNRLQEMDQQAIILINTLKKEYGIE